MAPNSELPQVEMQGETENPVLPAACRLQCVVACIVSCFFILRGGARPILAHFGKSLKYILRDKPGALHKCQHSRHFLFWRCELSPSNRRLSSINVSSGIRASLAVAAGSIITI